MVENSKVKILWDFGIVTVSLVASNHPDLVVLLKKAPEKILLIEMSCPADTNIFTKEAEKITKYQWLVVEISRTYCQPVVVVPVVFGASGVISKDQRHYLKNIPAFNELCFATLQKVAILGTVSILT